jgi:maleate isomerase
MTDSLGYRKKFSVVAPSTNTVVQPEYDAMRPHGVTNRFGRIHIPNDPAQRRRLQPADGEHPHHHAAGDRPGDDLRAASETFWDGLKG